jgi:DNA-binding CsgD family transcriptional regulator
MSTAKYPHRSRPSGTPSRPATYGLTRRERQVLRLMAQGLPARKIAARLDLSPNTITTHLKKAYKRLGVHNRTRAVVKILTEGLARPEVGRGPAQSSREAKLLPLPAPASLPGLPSSALPRNGRRALRAASSAIGPELPPPRVPLNCCPHCGSDLKPLSTPAQLQPH